MSTFSYIALTKPYISLTFNSHDDSKCALTTGEKIKTNQEKLRLFSVGKLGPQAADCI